MQQRKKMLLLRLLFLVGATTAFRHPAVSFGASPACHRTSNRLLFSGLYEKSELRLYESSDPVDDRGTAVNGQSGAPATTSGGGGGLVTAADSKSQLFSAFTALELPDQYDAVLTGLCAKILDNPRMSEAESITALQDPVQLIQEMNEKNIPASPRSIMALVDSTVKTQDAMTMARVISMCTSNGGLRQYGSEQADILPFPISPTSKVKTLDGSVKTRAERLESVNDYPTDDRAAEVANALAVSAFVGACGLTNVLGMEDVTPYSNTLLTLLVLGIIVDNFYDLVKTGSTMVVQQIGGKDNDKAKDFKMPEKDSLPLGLGSGKISGSVVRGLTRLLTVDAERESQAEAAALFAAYTLGLPCFAFRPNALEGSVMVVESMKGDNELDSLMSSTGIMRVLVWMMAPVAMESMKHTQLIMSDPREAEGLLQRLEDFAANDAGLADEIWWAANDDERADLLKWSYTEADLLLRDNSKSVSEISQRLMGGAATIGDCIAVVEKW